MYTLKRVLVVGAIALSAVRGVAVQCPTIPPNDAVGLSLSCGWLTACPNGPVTLVLEPQPSGGFPPAPYDPGYTIQPCDTVTWSFGDGMTGTVIGSKQIIHDYPVPGNYTVGVTITNSLGTATVNFVRSLVIASDPARVSFVTPGAPYPWSCSACVLTNENAGAVTIEVVRSLDLSRTISVVVEVNGAAVLVPTIPRVSQILIFAPNETRKTLVIPITDDQMYYGPRFYPLVFSNPIGGVLTETNTFDRPTLLILDDDPQPVLSIEPTATVTEGNSGLTPFSIPIHLSAPMQIDVVVNVFFESGTATIYNDFEPGPGGLRIRAGETEGLISGSIRGDRIPEPDETFIVRLDPLNTNNDPAFGNKTAVVTIVNDDSGPASVPSLSRAALLFLGAALAVVALRFVR